MQPHIVVDISSHGYGHLAQVGPILGALRARVPDLRVTARSALPRAVVAGRLGDISGFVPLACDPGMRMATALDVRTGASAAAYAAFHRDWRGALERDARVLAGLAPQVLLADIPYRSLAAASLAEIPAVATCSLHWGDIYRAYCGHYPEAPDIHAQIIQAYRTADRFLQLTPHMPMLELPRRESLAPVAALGEDRRDELKRRLGLSRDQRLVLIGLGGVATRLAVEAWPTQPGIHWLAPADWCVRLPHWSDLERLDLPFIDLLASCDALITKPGYGAFAEAACHGVRVVYARRGDWPEEPYLARWLEDHSVAASVERQALEKGEFGQVLARLLNRPTPPPVHPAGAVQAADRLARYFS